MSHTRLFRFNLILLVAGLIIAPWPPIVAVTPSPRDIARSASTLVPLDNPIYVDADAPGPVHDGLSWTTAYTDLQDALITATFGSEIWVAEGIYMPSDAADPAATFELPSDIAVYGGFGGDEILRSQRDWVLHPTVLSGDIDHNDVTTASGVVTDTANITGTNAYHVLTANYVSNSVLDGFIVTAGLATGDDIHSDGGGMYTLYGSLVLADVAFSGNRASDEGGGVYNLYSGLALLNVVFNDNQARFGGGMYNDSSNSSLTDVTFDNNHASERGGGMVDGGNGSNLTNVIFSNNQADYAGGGMSIATHSSAGSILIGVTFTGNQAGYGGGGGIHNYGSPTLITVTLSNNQAKLGAGMFNENGSPTLTDVIFNNNVAEQGGGGLYNMGTNPSPTLTRVAFSNNQARDGGGMYNIYPNVTTLTDVTFTGNQVLNYGGGMYNGFGAAPTVITATFSANEAMDGGGMYNDDSDPALTNVTFNNNLSSSGNGGGGMLNFVSTPTLLNVTFTGNSAIGNSMSGGGGIYNVSSDPVLTNVIFDDNQADAYGGGIQNSGSDPTMTNVVFNHNQASSGGGMYNRDASAPTLMTVTFTSNLADSGGGMLNTGGSHPTLTHVTFADNQATTSGGGMENDWDSNPILTNVTFNGNSANDGGGMRNFNSSPYLDNVVLSGNQAAGYGGGIANEEGSYPILINATFGGNRAGYGNGGGIYNNDSNPTLVNCILWGNEAYADPEISNVGTSLPNITYSDVFWASGVYTGTGNLNLDPQFVSPITATIAPTTTGDYHLLPTSPVIDAGNNFSVTVSVDRDGGPRRMNVPSVPDTGLGTLPIVDMGAYEVEGVVVTLTLGTGGNGTILSDPPGPTFDYGIVVTLTAAPRAGSTFIGWDGDLNGTTNPITLTMDADKNVTGTFALNTYTLTLNTIGNGIIASEPPGATFAYGTVITLTALPGTGSTFAGWSGDLGGTTNPVTLTMDANKSITATFAFNTYALTLNTIGNGTITSEPPGPTFAYGTVITLTALPGTGAIFAGWSGDLDGLTNPITLTMDADKSITATFTFNTYTLTLHTSGDGTITSEPLGPTFAYGTIVTLTATPNAGSAFTGWSGDLSGTINPITLTMDADKSITATFALSTYTLTLNTIGNGTITSEPPGPTFAYGTIVSLTATPGAGSIFAGWSGDLSGTTNPITLTIDANKMVTAAFQWRVHLPLTMR